MKGNDIGKKQNEERMLRYQCASRIYYNRAEKLNYLAWICCIITWLAIFLPASFAQNVIVISAIFILNIMAFIFHGLMAANVSWASKFRKYFDAYVLGIDIDQFTSSDVQALEENSIKVLKHSAGKSKKQITNTGRDNYPGVRNWYDVSSNLSMLDAVFECQRQNGWWNKKGMKKRFIYSAIALLIFVALAIILATRTKVKIPVLVLSSSGLIIRLFERLIANWRYYRRSNEIDGALNVLSDSRSYEQVKYLQSLIDDRRAMLVFEVNCIHKKHAKEYSELYQKIAAFQK